MKNIAQPTAILFAELQHPGKQPAGLFFDSACDI